MTSLLLASSSPHRLKMLRDAGLEVETESARIDERAVEESVAGSGLSPEDLALLLAEAKATDVAERNPERLVIGCDQALELDGKILHKAGDMEAARRRLLLLSGRSHKLHSAVVVLRHGHEPWRHVSTARLRMRPLDPGYVGRHLALAGEDVLGSVGAYRIEGPGIQLFEEIDGDHFTIIGLPLLPLLDHLRGIEAIDG